MSKSKIEWTDDTWNPVTGCDKISAGCANCYAEPMARRLKAMGQPNYVDGFAVRCHPEALKKTWGKKPKRIFVPSMSDLFHKDVPLAFIRDVFSVVDRNPQHTFITLTKRPENMQGFSRYKEFPKNLWCGTSIENVDNRRRLSALINTYCYMRFVSFEPLLGPMPTMNLKGLDWVIVCGESGPGARPMHPDWARGIRDQCITQGVPFFFKQWGAFKPMQVYEIFKNKEIYLNFDGTVSPAILPYGGRSIAGGALMARVGKKKAGCLLDGREWKQMPKGATE